MYKFIVIFLFAISSISASTTDNWIASTTEKNVSGCLVKINENYYLITKNAQTGDSTVKIIFTAADSLLNVVLLDVVAGTNFITAGSTIFVEATTKNGAQVLQIRVYPGPDNGKFLFYALKPNERICTHAFYPAPSVYVITMVAFINSWGEGSILIGNRPLICCFSGFMDAFVVDSIWLDTGYNFNTGIGKVSGHIAYSKVGGNDSLVHYTIPPVNSSSVLKTFRVRTPYEQKRSSTTCNLLGKKIFSQENAPGLYLNTKRIIRLR